MPVPRPLSILSTVPIIRITKTLTPLTTPIRTDREENLDQTVVEVTVDLIFVGVAQSKTGQE